MFKPCDLVYHMVEKDKYGVGVILDAVISADPTNAAYSTVNWMFPNGRKLDRHKVESNKDIVHTSFDCLSEEEQKWVRDTSYLQFLRKKYNVQL